jgi:4-alpha-glucanotransferase
VKPEDWGIEPGYYDVRGEWKEISEATRSALLTAMGADGDRPPKPPVKIVRFGKKLTIGPAELRTEDGGTEIVDDVLPPDLGPGYHFLTDRITGAETQLIVAPGRCYLPSDLRTWGWAVQTYALRSRSSWGMGDLGDLRRFVRWAAGQGAGAVIVNPFHAPDPNPLEDSPYFPGSRCYRNPLYLRIEEVPGASEAGVDIESFAAAGRALNENRLINRGAVHRLKMDALERLWKRFGRSNEFDAYCANEGELLTRYATFEVLGEIHGYSWRKWPAALQDSNSEAVRSVADTNRDRVRFHMWLQWLIDSQLAAAAGEVRLVNDLAVGVNPDGADAWLWSECFPPGITIGAPPDDFNLRGQAWGVSAFDPWQLQAHGYEPFVRMIRCALRHAGGLRYDHVMGLFRLFWIPAGTDPSEGGYVRYPHSDLLSILALESHRAGALMIGEDLGTVAPGVREELARRGVMSYRLLYFEKALPESYPECALAAVTNHDLPTLPGLLSGADVSEQRHAGVQPNTAFARSASRRARAVAGVDRPIVAIVNGCYRELAASPSRLVAATLEDALGVEQRPNIPGTTGERPNWRLALPLFVEDIEVHSGPRELAAIMAHGRGPGASAGDPGRV